MLRAIHNLRVEIVRYVSDDQPGWVACEFSDAEGRQHTIVDKVPVLSSEMLDASSQYPRPGFVGCKVLKEWRDVNGRDLARLSTETPCWIESTEGLTEFVVLPRQLSAEPKEVAQNKN